MKVEQVDPERYTEGVWYQVSALPTPFQCRDARDIEARYEQVERRRGLIEFTVVNTQTCALPDGTTLRARAEGRARQVSPEDTGRYSVSFYGQQPRDSRGNYWIVAVRERDAEYVSAVVATPDLDQVWLLHRERRISRRDLVALVARARENGVDFVERDSRLYVEGRALSPVLYVEETS